MFRGRHKTFSLPRQVPGHRGWYIRVYDRRTRKRTWIKGGKDYDEALEFRDQLYLGNGKAFDAIQPILEERHLEEKPKKKRRRRPPQPAADSPPADTPTRDAASESTAASASASGDLPWDNPPATRKSEHTPER